MGKLSAHTHKWSFSLSVCLSHTYKRTHTHTDLHTHLPYLLLPQVFYYQEKAYPPAEGRFRKKALWAGDILAGDASIIIREVKFTFNGTFSCQVKNPPDVHGNPGTVKLTVVHTGQLLLTMPLSQNGRTALRLIRMEEWSCRVSEWIFKWKLTPRDPGCCWSGCSHIDRHFVSVICCVIFPSSLSLYLAQPLSLRSLWWPASSWEPSLWSCWCWSWCCQLDAAAGRGTSRPASYRRWKGKTPPCGESTLRGRVGVHVVYVCVGAIVNLLLPPHTPHLTSLHPVSVATVWREWWCSPVGLESLKHQSVALSRRCVGMGMYCSTVDLIRPLRGWGHMQKSWWCLSVVSVIHALSTGSLAQGSASPSCLFVFICFVNEQL